MHSRITQAIAFGVLIHTAFALFISDATAQSTNDGNVLAGSDSQALKLLSSEDQANMEVIKFHIGKDYSDFKSIQEVVNFLEKVSLLVQKHPKNLAFAKGDLKEMHKFLSQESIARLIRVDTEPFHPVPVGEKMLVAQRAMEEDELTRKLFGGPMRSLEESRKQQVIRTEDGNHKDGNFFTSFWCKISGGCHQ